MENGTADEQMGDIANEMQPEIFWEHTHRSVFAYLLGDTFDYYRRHYSLESLQEDVNRQVRSLQPFMENAGMFAFAPYIEGQVLITDSVLSQPSCAILDIKVLEQKTADYIVELIYEDKSILANQTFFQLRVPGLCFRFWTRLFHSTLNEFYRLVIDTFHAHDKRSRIAGSGWET